MTNELNFPSGKFTHTELAAHNGKTNQQVWTAYQAAIKDGMIIPAGERPNLSGKGKPSKLWEVNPKKNVAMTPLSLVGASAPAPVVKVVKPKPAKVEKTVKPEEPKAGFAELAEAIMTVPTLPVVAPTVAPEPEPEVEVVRRPVVMNLTSQVTEIEQTCPFCKTKLLSISTEGGVKVWCPINDLKICTCSENPYGVSNNVKNAYEILVEKFYKHRPMGKA